MENISDFEDTKNITKDLPPPKTYKLTHIKPNASNQIEQKYAKDYVDNIIVCKGDSITTAYIAGKKQPGSRILVLNFANNDIFCDNKFTGNTQEVDIACRTNLYWGLSKDLYPISQPDDQPTFLLSKSVSIVKDKRGKSVEPIIIDIVSSAAKKLPVSISDEDDFDNERQYYNEKDKITTTEKIKNIVNLASYYDVFITGAWGMGVYCNPKYGLINIWKKVLAKIYVPLTFFVIPEEETLLYFHKHLKYKN